MHKPWPQEMWCISPQQDVAFVRAMENVVEGYTRPYDVSVDWRFTTADARIKLRHRYPKVRD